MKAVWLGSEETIDADALAAEGVLAQTWPLDAYDAPLEALMKAHGYGTRDEVELQPTTPGLDAICAKFVEEHLHTDDEVRFVLEGEGVFDIRSRDDRWMHVRVAPGDLLVVPAHRHHRFYLTESKSIRCVRLFQDASGWVPHYRAST